MTEKTTLSGLTNMTSIIAFCASSKPHVSGGYRFE